MPEPAQPFDDVDLADDPAAQRRAELPSPQNSTTVFDVPKRGSAYGTTVRRPLPRGIQAKLRAFGCAYGLRTEEMADSPEEVDKEHLRRERSELRARQRAAAERSSRHMREAAAMEEPPTVEPPHPVGAWWDSLGNLVKNFPDEARNKSTILIIINFYK